MAIEKEIIIEIIKSEAKTLGDLSIAKRKAAKKRRENPPGNIDILKFYSGMSNKQKSLLFSAHGKNYNEEKDAEIRGLLKTRPVRSLSGISNVSVLTKPYPCPGECIYCPQEENIPKSYLSNEPAVMRAIMNNYDPSKQVKTRINGLKIAGHPTDKIELRIIGATWSHYPKAYQKNFIKKCFESCNARPDKNPESAQKRNEKAKHRIVGLSIETRPDYIDEKEIKRLRDYGVTSVELGVQSIYDDVLKAIKRGHDKSVIIKATKMLKDAGFKVCYQMMPGLPLSNLQRDAEMFKELFVNPDFQPDFLKIYPVMVIKGTELYDSWRKKRYKPYNDEDLKFLIKEIKKNIPRYVRIQRIIRDIPSQSIEAGTKLSNLRQLIKESVPKEQWQCQCIRCREIKEDYDPDRKLKIFRKDYEASGGIEIFLSFEDIKRKNIYSLLRLRIINDSAIIRDVHTYGQHLPIKNEVSASPQHRGLGKQLIMEAERTARSEFGAQRIAVISGVGVRQYYRILGYRLKDTYMIKSFF